MVTYVGHGFIGTSNSNTINVPKPTGLATNDLILAFAAYPNGWSITAPSGFSSVASCTTTGVQLVVYRKVAGSSEPSTYTWSTPSGSGLFCVNMSAYRDVLNSDPFDTIKTATGTTTSLATGSFTTTQDDFIVVVDASFANASSSTCTASGLTERDDAWQPATDNTFTRAIAVYDTNGLVSTGSHTYTGVRNTAAYHDIIAIPLKPNTITSTMSASLPKVTSSLAGQVIFPSGSFASTLKPVAFSGLATAAPPSGIMDTDLPRVTSSFAATSTGGAFTASLGKVQALFAAKIISGAFSATLPHPTRANLVGASESVGSFAATLKIPKVDFLIETRPHGQNVIVVDEEQRGFRITQYDMIPIYKHQIGFLFDGAYGPMKIGLSVPHVAFGGNVGPIVINLPKVTSSFVGGKEVSGPQNVTLRAIDTDMVGETDPSTFVDMQVGLPRISGVDFTAYAAVSWVSTGGFVSGTSDLTVPLPTSYQLSDVLLMGVVTDESGSVATPSGWTRTNPSPQTTSGTSDTGNALSVFWRVVDGSETAPVITDTGTFLGGAIHAFHGCDIVDGPIDVTGGIYQVPDDLTATMPSLSTSAPDDMVVYFGGHGFPTASPEATLATSDADLANVTARTNASTTDGGGMYVFTANCPPSSFIDSATFTLADASERTGIVVALLSSAAPSSLVAGGPIAATLPHAVVRFQEDAHADMAVTLPHPMTSAFAGGLVASGSFSSTLRPVTASFTATAEDLVKFTQTIGNGSLTTFTITHSFSTRDVMVSVYDLNTNEEAVPTVVHTTTSAVTLTFAVAPTTNQYRVVVFASI